jgi:hypothetical protein
VLEVKQQYACKRRMKDYCRDCTRHIPTKEAGLRHDPAQLGNKRAKHRKAARFGMWPPTASREKQNEP